MIAYILELVIAIIICRYVYSWKWWVISIVFPLVMSASNLVYRKDQPLPDNKYRMIVDTCIMLTQTGYVISQVIIYQRHIGSWYGWIIGLIIGWVGSGKIAPHRWRHELQMPI